jgi:proton-translocating NADH-quinone oxidoreductase chain N
MDFILVKSFLPEIFLSTCILLQILNNSVFVTISKLNFPLLFKELTWQYTFILLCLTLLYLNNLIEASFYNFLFLNDLSTTCVKVIILLSCILSFFSVTGSFKTQYLNFFEFFFLFALALLASLLLVSATDLLSVYLLIEMQALAFYSLASFKRNSSFSVEAGLKYFISGSFFSSLFLLGTSILYGIFGTVNLVQLKLLFLLPVNDLPQVYQIGAYLAIVLVTVVFFFKLGITPFHFWVPDVYEGAPLSTTIIFSTLPKLSLTYIFLKWLLVLPSSKYLYILLVTCGLVSILWCSFFALQQKRVKRFLIFSSLAQSGFILLAASHLTTLSLVYIYFFLLLYLLTTVLIWIKFSFFVSFVNVRQVFNGVKTFKPLFLSFFTSFYVTSPIWALSNVFIFFSLAGIPPFVGFLAKILILYSLLQSNNGIVFLAAILISSISTYYYLKILKFIFFNGSTNKNKIKVNYVIVESVDFYTNLLISATLLLSLLMLFFAPSVLILVCHFLVAFCFFI